MYATLKNLEKQISKLNTALLGSLCSQSNQLIPTKNCSILLCMKS